MLRQAAATITVDTRGRGLFEITSEISVWVAGTEISNGLLTGFCATRRPACWSRRTPTRMCGPISSAFSRLVPDGDPLFRHRVEGPDDMPAHVRAALTSVQLSIPVSHRRLVLGTWQGIYVWEHRLRPHRREVALHLLGE